MSDNPHFETALSWKDAETTLTFKPVGGELVIPLKNQRQ